MTSEAKGQSQCTYCGVGIPRRHCYAAGHRWCHSADIQAAIDTAVQAEADRVKMAKERIAQLEKYVGEHLSYMGACEDGDDESLCESPDCTYCQMARALQPIECGWPLSPAPGGSDDE